MNQAMPDSPTPQVGPLFISGRQHSGNTVTACVFENVPDCLAVNVEGLFFEHRGLVQRIKDPAQRADYLVDLLRFEDGALMEETRAWLVGWHREHADASPVDAYREAMRFATTARGKRFWVRRATSYIFYAQEILTLMPEARMLFLLRNPYDICASLKRRDARLDRLWSPVLSWNRGLRTAARLQEAFPDRFLIVRYEDMVTEPTDVFRRIFAFVGVGFREAYLDVPHVNRSEAQETREIATRGLTPSRVYHYQDLLSSPEVAAIDLLVWNQGLLDHYPELPHRKTTRRGGTWVKALALLAGSPIKLIRHEARRLARHDIRWQIRRLLRRAVLLVPRFGNRG